MSGVLGSSEAPHLTTFLSSLIADAPPLEKITSVDLAISHMSGVLSSRYLSTENTYFQLPTLTKEPGIACPFILLGGIALLNRPCFAKISTPYELRTHVLEHHYSSNQRQYHQRPCPTCGRIGGAGSRVAQEMRDCLQCCFVLRQDQYDQISCKKSQSRKTTEEVNRILRIITNLVPSDSTQNYDNVVSLSDTVRLWVRHFLDFIIRSKICDFLRGIYNKLPLRVRELPDCPSQSYMVDSACAKWLLGALKHCACQEAESFANFQENSSWWYSLFSSAA